MNNTLKWNLDKNGWTVIFDEFDLTTATQNDINTIGKLIANNTCVVAKNQKLTIADELKISKMFGNVESGVPAGYEHLPPYCHVLIPNSENAITRVTGALDEHGEIGLFGHVSDLDWHCNQPALIDRKPIVFLYGVEGTKGSRTSWTNNILAYNDLSNDLKNQIKDLKMVCGWKKDAYSEYDFGRAKNGIVEDYNEYYNPNILHTNIAGQTGLFFPFLQFRNFIGMTVEESQALASQLRNHILQEKYIYHHDWQDGDVVLSEQWLGLHKRWAFDNIASRLLHRITVDFTNCALTT